MVLVVALALGWSLNRQATAYLYKVRERDTRAIHDAQKEITDKVHEEFVRELTQRGYSVSDRSGGSSGSGDWRFILNLVLSRKGEEDIQCYVEVQGFVNNSWTDNLP